MSRRRARGLDRTLNSLVLNGLARAWFWLSWAPVAAMYRSGL
ncbi:hypothetical protein PBI_ANDREW_63 [Arthrobacter phage Andrew]|uniref:Uncharacterized protein n=1 Tax=Arthrobacter phage Andrew TaxID=2419946 RepID=A0A3G2KD12_9CAUD|nr:hypothetical protein HOU53_gp63 [Arthrobacter phage Andrew]AYN56877.1 hypothetical protein PBI_ANDREW_63 [Arthrobacter phage Andrew]